MISLRWFHLVLVMMILSTTIGTLSALSEHTHTIPSWGSIHVTSLAEYRSEIRGVQIAPANIPINNWPLVAQTLADYDINVVIGVFRTIFEDQPKLGLQEAITALHALGIELHANHHTLGAWTSSDDYAVTLDDGSIDRHSACPTKNITRELLKSQVEDLATYDIDGYIFDYHRYMNTRMCFCQECKARFEEWLGETIPDSNWPPSSSDFADGGPRHNEFLRWRIAPITELVRDIRSWMAAKREELGKPPITFGAAVWNYGSAHSPALRPKRLGQDWNEWVAKGYLDWTNPMLYITDLDGIADDMDAYHEYGTGGPEGKAQVIPYLNINPQGGTSPTPAEFKAQVDTVRAHGGDGFIIWRYGGPGNDPNDPYNVDIRPYLETLDVPQTFSLGNIYSEASATGATIEWATTSPSTSKVEYSTSPLFNASMRYDETQDFDYWDIDHVEGAVAEYTAQVTEHSVTITGLEQDKLYYYRVQSTDQSGTATSEVYTFET